jgi:hypothetical protein
MNMLIVTPEEAMELATLNGTGDPTRELAPAPLQDGNYALNADLLEDCAPGETWEHYADFLEALPIENIPMAEIEEPQLA